MQIFFKRAFLMLNKTRLCSTSVNLKDIPRKEANEIIRVQLAAAYRGLDAYGLNEGVCNHLTAIAPAANSTEDVMLVIPHGLHFSEVTPSLLIGVNKNNEVIEGKGEPEITAVCIHKGIYTTRSNINCIMHTHMPYATALGCLYDSKLYMLHQNPARFYNRVAYDTNYQGLGNSFEEGKRLGHVLGDKDVMFMCNHGVITVAKSVALAFDNMYYLERAAMIQVLALSTGKETKEMPPEIVKLTEEQLWKSMEKYACLHLAAVTRKLQKSNTEFKL